MTHKRPRRLSERQCEQIFLTEDFTFIQGLLRTPGYPCAPSVWIQTQFDTVPDKYFNSVQTHFAGEVRQDDFAVLELHAKKSIR
jgi:hypothetical protein